MTRFSFAFGLLLSSLFVGCAKGTEVDALNARVSAMEKRLAEYDSYPLAFEERCSAEARRRFADMGHMSKNEPTASFETNYNTKLKRCFMRVFTVNAGLMSIDVVDVSRGRTYGRHYLYSKSRELNQCSVVLPDGVQRQCESEDEFDKLVEVYMGDLRIDSPK